MSKITLTPEQMRIIRQSELEINEIIKVIDNSRSFKNGDYLVLYLTGEGNQLKQSVNCYGAPIKYQVVHTSESGISFIMKLNKAGKPTGSLMSTVGMLDNDDYRFSGSSDNFEFRLDPDYADAILLEDNYDPAVLHKSKKDIWKAVTDHNKLNKINTKKIENITDFFRAISNGDMMWTSSKNYYIVKDKKHVSKHDAHKIVQNISFHRVKGPLVMVLTLQDKKGNLKEVAADFFYYKALYKQCPRSYKELKI